MWLHVQQLVPACCTLSKCDVQRSCLPAELTGPAEAHPASVSMLSSAGCRQRRVLCLAHSDKVFSNAAMPVAHLSHLPAVARYVLAPMGPHRDVLKGQRIIAGLHFVKSPAADPSNSGNLLKVR